MPDQTKPTYVVIDRQTGQTVASRTTRKAAQKKADALDLAYGAIRYFVLLGPVKADARCVFCGGSIQTCSC